MAPCAAPWYFPWPSGWACGGTGPLVLVEGRQAAVGKDTGQVPSWTKPSSPSGSWWELLEPKNSPLGGDQRLQPVQTQAGFKEKGLGPALLEHGGATVLPSAESQEKGCRQCHSSCTEGQHPSPHRGEGSSCSVLPIAPLSLWGTSPRQLLHQAQCLSQTY